MGNNLSPRYAEFAAEFKRLEAAIAAEEAKPTLDRDAAVLRELPLELLKLKICSAEYWCRLAHNLANTHEIVPETCYYCEVHPTDGCCRGVCGAHKSSAIWRRSQEAFYQQLLAALEEEKAAWQQRRPVKAAPLPALPEMPTAEWVLPEGIPCCPSCISFLKEFNKEEPLLRHRQEIYCSQGDIGQATPDSLLMADPADKYVTGKDGERRMKGVTLTVPVLTGTCAFFLGKKASEYQSHKWTVYMRSPTGEDLSHVTFVLHESFQNPRRDVEMPPYELTETGWGEFDIVVVLHFRDDVKEGPLELYHRLKLYDDAGVSNPKKPVVLEMYDEVVLWQPTETFYNRFTAHKPAPAPPSQLAQYYTTFQPDAEYQRIQRARQRLAQIRANVENTAAQLEAAHEAGAGWTGSRQRFVTFKMSPSTRDVSQSCSAHDWAAERRHSNSQCCGSQAQLEEARAQAHTLQRLQQQLQEATPGAAEQVAAAVEQERAAQAARDAQLLALLRTKDDVITSFQARHAESRAEAATHQEQLESARQQLQASQLRVHELVESRNRQRQQVEQAATAAAAAAQEIVRLKAEAARAQALQDRLMLLEQRAGHSTTDIEATHRQLAVLSATADAANDAIVDLQALLEERDKDVAVRDAELAALRQHLDNTFQNSAGCEPVADEAAACKLAALEAVNEQLELALVHASCSTATGDSEGGATDELRAKLAVATGRLQAADAQVEQLEKRLEASEAAVLRSELQLRERLAGSLQAEQQAEMLRLELDAARLLAAQLKAQLAETAVSEQTAREEATAAQRSMQAAVDELVSIFTASDLQQQQVLQAQVILDTQQQRQQQQQQDGSRPVGGLAADQPAAADPGCTHHISAAAAEAVANVRALACHVRELQQRLDQQQDEAAAPLQQQAASAQTTQAVGIQCDLAETQSSFAPTAKEQLEEAAPEAEDSQGVSAAPVGQLDLLQQQVAQLTAELAAATLAAAGAKADLAAFEAARAEAECKRASCIPSGDVVETQFARGQAPDCNCPAAATLQAECSSLRLENERLGSCVVTARREAEAQAAEAAAAAHMQLLRQVAALEQGRGELSELRSSAYSAAHRLQRAIREHSGMLGTEASGGEEAPLTLQLKRAVDGCLSLLQDHAQLSATFRQHLLHQQQALSAMTGVEYDAGSGMTLEASQRVVIRSLAVQVAALQQQHAQKAPAGASMPVSTPAAGPGMSGDNLVGAGLSPGQTAAASLPADVAQLLGMLSLLKQQLNGLEHIQAEMGAALGSSSESATCDDASGSSSSSSSARAAALLGAELPALQATVSVLAAQLKALPLKLGGGVVAATVALPCLPPEAPAARDALRRKDKWKARCKDVQTQLAAARNAEAKGGFKLGAAELALAEQAAQTAGVVQMLQARVEELAAAGAQLESELHETARQLSDAARTEESLHTQLVLEQQEHEAGMAEASARLLTAQAALQQEQQQHSALAAQLQGMVHTLHHDGHAEQLLHTRLADLSEQVAQLMIAQEVARSESQLKQQSLDDLRSLLAAARGAQSDMAAACAASEAESQRREAALVGRLQAMQLECVALLEVASRAEEQHTEVEQRLQAGLDLLGRQLDELGNSSAAFLPGLTDALSNLSPAGEMEGRLLRLEAQAAVILQDRSAAAVGHWAVLVRGCRYRSAVSALRDGLQTQLLDAQAACQQQAAELQRLHAALETAQHDASELGACLEAAQLQHQAKLRAAEQHHNKQLDSALQAAAQEQREAQQAADESIAAAVAEVEQRCKVEMAARVARAEQRALHGLEAAEQQCEAVRGELEAVQTAFQQYQATRVVEVQMLEQRVLQQLHSNARPGKAGSKPPASMQQQQRQKQLVRNAGAVSVEDLKAACRQVAIDAALREARLDRLQRDQAVEALAGVQATVEQLGTRARALEQELAATRRGHVAESSQLRQRAEQLTSDLADCQRALSHAKAEGSRRMKELQALQRQAAAVADENGSRAANSTAAAAAQLEAELQAQAAGAQLREARQGLARKSALINEMRAKVDGLEQRLAASDPAPLLAELEACQARLQHSQAACASREAAVRELRQRLQQESSLVREEREQHQVHSQLHDASTGLRAAVDSHSNEAEGAAAELLCAQRCALELAQAVQQLLELVGQLGVATATAAEAACAAEQRAAWPASMQSDISGLVGLTLDDFQIIMQPSPGTSAALEAAVQPSITALQDLKASLTAGDWQAAESAAGSLMGLFVQITNDPVATRLRTQMGNWLIKPLPHRPEFVAEFLRVQAAVAAQEALQELDGDLQCLLQLRLQFVDLKIVCAKYWRDKTRDMAGYHEKEMNGWMLIPAQTCTMKPYICEGGLLAHQRPAAWRRTQESFFCRLLALLEEERSALQEGRLVSASPLPALDEVPHTLPVDPSPAPCWMCSKYIAKVHKLEPGEHSPKGVTGFCWLPTPPYDIEYGPPGPVTPSGGAAPAGQSACVAFVLLPLHKLVVTRPWRMLQMKAQGLLRQARKARTRHQLGITKLNLSRAGRTWSLQALRLALMLNPAVGQVTTQVQMALEATLPVLILSLWQQAMRRAAIRTINPATATGGGAAAGKGGGECGLSPPLKAVLLSIEEWESCLEQEKQKEQEEKEEEIIEPRGKVISHQRRRLDRGQPVTQRVWWHAARHSNSSSSNEEPPGLVGGSGGEERQPPSQQLNEGARRMANRCLWMGKVKLQQQLFGSILGVCLVVRAMGNTLSPRSVEFAAEFRRLEAAIAAEEAQPTLERNAAALRLLNLELLRYKICSAEYWCRIAHNLAKTHEIAPKRCYCCEVNPGGGCCPGVRGAHNSSAVWRLSQEAFYRQLLAALEEEKAAWQQRRPVVAAPLPALPVVPVAEWILPEGIPSCPSCISFLKEFNKEEPLLRHRQEIYCSQDVTQWGQAHPQQDRTLWGTRAQVKPPRHRVQSQQARHAWQMRCALQVVKVADKGQPQVQAPLAEC
ncbi:Transcription initiation factor TFIID subunit 14b [Chlorella vulgaris]